jgi:uncharacterized protein (DUF302 family)
MFYRSTILAVVAVAAVALTAGHWPNMATAKTTDDGIVRVKSTYDVDETVKRLKADIEGKGIKFFMLVDQAQLGADAGLKLNPSKLLVFGNPPLGITFLTANPNAGLDWPVRLLVNRDDVGQVWVAYTDFAWIARRHNITNRATQFKMASEVISSITASVAARKP